MEKVELNADFSKRASAHGSKIDWLASPMKGVERRMLERIGDEVARATTIVRYAPRSKFSAHIHTGGEEFLVLDGVFQDEPGDFPQGTYVRNPPNSRHTPGSDNGCTILVKLWQMEMTDQTHVIVDTNKIGLHHVVGRDHAAIASLFNDGREDVRIERWDARQTIAFTPDGGIEFFVIEGAFEENGETFNRHSWLRLPVGNHFDARAGDEGALVLVKEGHLAKLEREAYATMKKQA